MLYLLTWNCYIPAAYGLQNCPHIYTVDFDQFCFCYCSILRPEWSNFKEWQGAVIGSSCLSVQHGTETIRSSWSSVARFGLGHALVYFIHSRTLKVQCWHMMSTSMGTQTTLNCMLNVTDRKHSRLLTYMNHVSQTYAGFIGSLRSPLKVLEFWKKFQALESPWKVLEFEGYIFRNFCILKFWRKHSCKIWHFTTTWL